MELSEINKRLKTLGIPVAYMKFSTPQKLPFLIYKEAGSEIIGADGYNMYRRVYISLELYSEKKDIKLERQIESLFRDIPIDKSPDIFLPDENMHEIEFSFETIQYIQED